MANAASVEGRAYEITSTILPGEREREGGREKALRIRSLAADTGVRHEGECNKKLGLN